MDSEAIAVQQRPVEELLVQPGDRPHRLRPAGAQVVGVGARAQHEPGEPAPALGLLGQHVGAGQPLQLQAVLEDPQEPVRAVELCAVVTPDVAVRGERLQRDQRAGGAQPGVGAAVDQLQQLHRELDVAQAAAAQLELPVGLLGRDVLDHPSAHGPGGLHEPLALGHLPDHRRDRLEPAAPRSASPATTRALSMAWNSHGSAHRS